MNCSSNSSPTKSTPQAPVVQNINISTLSNTSVEFTLSAVESENLPLVYSISSQPSNGQVELNGTNGVYTPDTNFIGIDTFAYVANSLNGQSNIGIVQVTVSRDENNFEMIFSIEDRGIDGIDIVELSDGTIVLLCNARSSGGFDNAQAVIIGLNNSYNEIWRKFIGKQGGSTSLIKIKESPDGSFFVFGTSENSFYLLKFTSSGQFLWSQTYGNSDYTQGRDFEILDDGSVVMIGHTNINGYVQTLIIKTDSNGNVLQESTYGEDGQNNSRGRGIVKAPDGGYMIANVKIVGDQNTELVKISASGETEWAQVYSFDSSKQRDEEPRSISIDQQGNYYIAVEFDYSSTQQKTLLFKVNSQGSLIWNQEFYGHLFFDIENTTDDFIILTGADDSYSISQVFKFNKEGNLIGQKSFGNSANQNSSRGIIELNNGNYAIINSIYANQAFMSLVITNRNLD